MAPFTNTIRLSRLGISLEPIRKLAETPLGGSFVRLPDHKLSGLFRPGEQQLREKPEELVSLRNEFLMLAICQAGGEISLDSP